MKKIIFGIAIALLIVVLSGAMYVRYALPDVGKSPDIKVDVTPERVARGKYLAYHVAVCMDCHSTRDWSKYSGPYVPGTDGKGGEYFGPEVGFPGKFYSKNLTPYHLKDWTDGDIYRAVTSGVSKDGSALFPVMPYQYYGKMDPDDVYDIIAFLRTLAPVKNTTPPHSVDFPINFILNTIPEKAKPEKRPPVSDTIAYGAYLTNMAGCMECHTPFKNNQMVKGKEYTGGREFKLPGMTLYSKNITPDVETGIGAWTPEEFVARFKSYAAPDGTPTVGKNAPQTIMPWSMYGGMDSTDLLAIYKFLRTIPPVKHKVEAFVPAVASK